jgi:predicted O-methyltransferase YrrM
VLGEDTPDLLTQIVRRDPRAETFFRAIEFVNYERVPGDIVEAGVFGGLSLAVLAKGATLDPKGMTRRIVGLDTFDGLPPASEAHARWTTGDCARVAVWHPLAGPGTRVSADLTRQLFARCGLEPPLLYEGPFAEVLPRLVPAVHPEVALLHVDCDLYESTRDLLGAMAPALQDGTVVLFDDWFHYKGHPHRGEARAFHEFLDAHSEWDAVPWTTYGTFCRAFILSRR